MQDDYDWHREVTRSCPIWAQDLNREIMVEWVVEHAKCDAGLMQVEYTASPDVDSQFVSAGVSASVWEYDDDDRSYSMFKGIRGLQHIGLAKRWAVAQAELWTVEDANEFLLLERQGVVWEDDEGDDWFGFDD